MKRFQLQFLSRYFHEFSNIAFKTEPTHYRSHIKAAERFQLFPCFLFLMLTLKASMQRKLPYLSRILNEMTPLCERIPYPKIRKWDKGNGWKQGCDVKKSILVYFISLFSAICSFLKKELRPVHHINFFLLFLLFVVVVVWSSVGPT